MIRIGAAGSLAPARKARWGRALRALLWVVGASLFAQATISQTAESPANPPVLMVEIDDIINPGSAGLLAYAIETAEKSNAQALIVRIDTPGGLLTSTRDMVSAISQAQVPVIGYVGPPGASATSAGAFILLSTHLAAMNTGTNVGAASPVAGDGTDIQGTMAKKVMNDSRAFMRSIASSRERNVEAAEAFVSEATSLSALQALDANVVDLVVPDLAGLVAALNGRKIFFQGEPVTLSLSMGDLHPIKPRLIDRLLSYIAHPQIAHMLLSLGALALYIEILSPGLALPGILGTIAVILGLVGVHALPVNVAFLALLVLGVGLMAAEYFVAGFGILGIGGAIAFTLGSLNLFDGSISAEYRSGIVSLSIAVSAAMLLTSFLISHGFRAKGETLPDVQGKEGEAMFNFDKNGFVLVDGRRWPATTVEPLRHKDKVVVVGKNEAGELLVKRGASDSQTI